MLIILLIFTLGSLIFLLNASSKNVTRACGLFTGFGTMCSVLIACAIFYVQRSEENESLLVSYRPHWYIIQTGEESQYEFDCPHQFPVKVDQCAAFRVEVSDVLKVLNQKVLLGKNGICKSGTVYTNHSNSSVRPVVTVIRSRTLYNEVTYFVNGDGIDNFYYKDENDVLRDYAHRIAPSKVNRLVNFCDNK